MKYRIIFTTLLSLFVTYNLIIACNDNNYVCEQALSLSELETHGTHCISSCNEGNPNNFFNATKQGCEASPFTTIWYHIEPKGEERILSIEFNSSDLETPLVSLFSDGCGNLQFLTCNQGFAGEVSLANLELKSGNEYWLSVANGQNVVGDFELCLTVDENPNLCNTNASLVATKTSMGSALWGPYLPGEDVEWCYIISGYNNESCNYLQAIIPSFGSGWAASSFDAEGQPINITRSLETQGRTNFQTANPVCEGDPAGEWLWMPSGAITYNLNSENPLGLTFRDPIPNAWVFLNHFDPDCFIFTDACCTNPTSDPNLGYGDDNYPICGEGNEHAWTVCFELTTNSQVTTTNSDCSVSIKTMADGETGVFIDKSCKVDLPEIVTASIQLPEEPSLIIADTNLTACAGETIFIPLSSDQQNVSYWAEDADQQIYIVEEDVLMIELLTAGTFTYQIYATNGRLSAPELVTITVITGLDVEIEQSPEMACPGEEVTLIAKVDFSGNTDELNFSWNGSPATNQGELVVSDLEDSFDLSVEYFGCTAMVETQITTFPVSTLTVSSEDELCHGSEATLRFEFDGIGPWSVELEDGEGTLTSLESDEESLEQKITATDDLEYHVISAFDGHGCPITIMGQLFTSVRPALSVDAGDDVTLDCATKTAELSGTMNVQLPEYSSAWISLEGHDLENEDSMNPIVTESGTYILELRDEKLGCVATDTVEVMSGTEIGLNILESDFIIDEGDIIELETFISIPESEISSVVWNHDGSLDCDTCLSTTAAPAESVLYDLTVVSTDGCVEILEVRVVVRPAREETTVDVPYRLFIPTAFDPRSTTEDNTFRVFAGDHIASIISFDIYDRWGNLVFNAENVNPDDPEAGWNGVFRGEIVNSGVYIYNLTLEMQDQTTDTFTGSITVIN